MEWLGASLKQTLAEAITLVYMYTDIRDDDVERKI